MNSFLIPAIFAILLLSSFTSLGSAQTIGNADIFLTDIYLEPAYPQPGDSVSIQSIVYNAGWDSTKSITDAVTVGYFVNGDLVKIAELPDILPGVENGVLISSGPIWTAAEGNNTITVILNYHDTLSSITDNLANNIVQKIFPIGQPKPSIVLFEVFQEYVPQTKTQHVTIKGNLQDAGGSSFLPDEIQIQIGNLHDDTIPVDHNGFFSFSKAMKSFDKIIPITITVEEKYPVLGSSYNANIYPIDLERDSILSFTIQNPSNFYNFHDSSVVFAIFDESYNLIKKIETANLAESEKTHDAVFTTLSSGTYITEIYFEGKFFHAVQTNLKENAVSTNSILIPDSSQVRFQVLEENGEPVPDVLIQNWIFTLQTDETGFTDWISVLPTLNDEDTYSAKAVLPNGKIFWSDPFIVDYAEKKIIQMVVDL